jgi:hypothetical protein
VSPLYGKQGGTTKELNEPLSSLYGSRGAFGISDFGLGISDLGRRTIMGTDEKPRRPWFEPIDPNLPAKERARLLEKAVEHFEDKAGVGPLQDSDIALLRQFAKDPDRKVREIAIVVLCDEAKVTWEEIERWALDPDSEVRTSVMYVMESSEQAAPLCESDKQRCADILAKVAEKYADNYVSATLWAFAEKSDEWLDATWQAAEKLIDLGDAKINEILCTGYLEYVLRYKELGPDDPRVKRWIESDKKDRKLALLAVAKWLGMGEGKLKAITEAVAKDSDEEVASQAKELIG